MEMRTNPGAQVWDRFVAERPRAHILQTTAWGGLKSSFGWEAERVAMVGDSGKGDSLLAGAQILYRRLPGGVGRLAYVPKGPLVDWENAEARGAAMSALEGAARARGAVALTVEPDLTEEARHREWLRGMGFRPSPLDSVQPRRTLIVDISAEEDEILAAMKSKTRYNIRLAGRRGVTVREAQEADLPLFNELIAATAARNEFGIHDLAYYERAYRLFVPRGWARLLLAEVEGETVAAVMVFALGQRSWYFYGASSTAHREKMPTYLLQWEAMRWARSLGCTEYDMWGVPDEDREVLEDNFTSRSDGLWGVYRFKRGFGGRLDRTVGAWDRPLRPLLYQLYRLGLRLQRTDQID